MCHGEALLHVARHFKFIHDGHGQVFHTDASRLLAIHQRRLGADPVLAGAFAGRQQDGRRQEGPVQHVFLADQLERLTGGQGASLVLGREFRRVHQLHAGRHIEAARAPDTSRRRTPDTRTPA